MNRALTHSLTHISSSLNNCMKMEAKFLPHFLFSTLLLLLHSSPPFTHAAAAADPHLHPPSAMDFLQPLLGTRKGNSTLGISKLKNFLSNLGYLDPLSPSTLNDIFDESLEKALKTYQTFFKLPVTGTLDAATLALMGQPRCGVRDSFSYNTTIKYTFFPGNPKWPSNKKQLSYSFGPNTMKEAYAAVESAANLWSGVSPFRFAYTTNYESADIKISFQYWNHGDGSNFDGRGGILAHAFAPMDGRLHFDGDEKWVNGVVGGSFDLQTVGLHELGHVLGLGHSTDGGSIMWPYIGNGFRKGLNNDDVAGIKALYS